MRLDVKSRLVTVALFTAVVASATAQTYPTKPVRLVIPSTPSGSLDITGRKLGQYLSPLLGQPVVIDNVPGAGNAIGTGEVAHARPDGYVLLLGASSGVILSPLIVKNPTYDGIRDLTAVSLLGLQYIVVAAGPGMPANSFKEMITLFRANPGKHSYASIGVGAITHLGGEVMNSMAKTSVVHVPYKGAGPALNDVIAGRVEIAPMTSVSVWSHYKSGKLRILASMSEERLPTLPDVPTTAELGFPGMVMSTFNGLFAPSATPRAIVNQLHQATTKVLANQNFQQDLENMGLMLPPPRTPEQTQRYLVEFAERVKPIIKSADIKEE